MQSLETSVLNQSVNRTDISVTKFKLRFKLILSTRHVYRQNDCKRKVTIKNNGGDLL